MINGNNPVKNDTQALVSGVFKYSISVLNVDAAMSSNIFL